jgi:hypothetical protein
MRALLRTRKQLVRKQASHVQRIQKTLEDADLKLGSMLTQIMGVSGRAILQALIDGERSRSTTGIGVAWREGTPGQAAGGLARAGHGAASVPVTRASAAGGRARYRHH